METYSGTLHTGLEPRKTGEKGLPVVLPNTAYTNIAYMFYMLPSAAKRL